MLYLPPNSPLEDRDRLILRLRSLLADLERIEAGWRPTSRDLAPAPRLDDWQLAQRPAPCLVGVAEGHPTIRGRRRTLTSDLWLLAPEHGFARTLSRFYRLGEPEGCD